MSASLIQLGARLQCLTYADMMQFAELLRNRHMFSSDTNKRNIEQVSAWAELISDAIRTAPELNEADDD